MQNNPSQTAAVLVLCFLCLAPFVLGCIAGAYYKTRRLATGSWLHALLPGFVIKILERYQ